jgi:hypothetical protein
MLRSSRTGPTKIGSLPRASAVIVGALVALFGVIAGPLLGVFASSSASAATAGSGYTAITPFRALGTSAAGAPVVAGTPANVAIVGNTAAPTAVPTGATAVVLNLTASAPTSAGYLTVYPEGGTAPATSNINFTAGETVANLVTVPLSTAGGITVSNFAGTTAVDVDVEGYYSAASAGLYNPVSPVRVAGTAAAGTPVAANTAVPVTVTGGTIPSTATAVVVNLTAAGGTSASYLSAYAAGATPATTSSLNFSAGETVANRDIVNVGTGGQIEVYNFAGSVNVDVDVDGYYGTTGSTFVALAAPIRLTDTRSTTNGSTLASGATETFNLTPTTSTIPTTATSVAANFTVVPGAAPGYITVFPTGVTTAPTASDVNWPAGSGAVANFTQADTAGTPTGSVQVYNLNSGSPVDLVIDAFGYFTSGTNVTSTTVNIAVPSTTSNTISVPADGASTRTITATVTDGAGGAVVVGDGVTYTLTPATGCGSFPSGDFATTTSTGVASNPYLAPTFSSSGPTSCTVTAKDSDFGQTGTATVTLTQPPNTVTLSPASATVAANGTTTDLLTAHVTAGAGTTGTANNDAVTFATSGTSCGTVGAPSGTTGSADSSVTATYTASATPGFCTVTATEALTGGTASTGIDQTSSPGLAATTVAFTPTAASTTPTFGDVQTFSVGVSNAGGAVPGDQVTFAVAVPSVDAGDTCGTVTPASGVTNSAGAITSVTYTAATTGTTISPSCNLVATEADGATAATLAVPQLATPPVVATLSTTAANDNVPINTSTQLNVSVTNVTNTADNGGSVTFAYVGGHTGCPTIPAATVLAVPVGATTGTASATFTANANVGTGCEIDAVVDNTAGTPAPIGTTNGITLDETA